MNRLKTHVIWLRSRAGRKAAAGVLAGVLTGGLVVAQEERERSEPRLPDGRSQKEEILKHEFRKAVDEAGELLKLAEELKADLERDDRHVLSIGTLKKTEEIEKLAKRIRGRLKRY